MIRIGTDDMDGGTMLLIEMRGGRIFRMFDDGSCTTLEEWNPIKNGEASLLVEMKGADFMTAIHEAMKEY